MRNEWSSRSRRTLCVTVLALTGCCLAGPAAAQERERPTAPPAPAAPENPPQLPGTRLAAGGGLLMGLGGFALLLATPFTISAAACGDDCGEHDVSLWPLMVAGGAVFAGGTAMLVVGLNERAEAKRQLSVGVGPGSVTLSGRF